MKLYKLIIAALILTCSCDKKINQVKAENEIQEALDSIPSVQVEELAKELTIDDIVLTKDLKYSNKYDLEDEYPYKDTVRIFQWNKIKEKLVLIENAQQKRHTWGVLSNYKNQNKEAALVYDFVRNAYKRVADTLGVERYQSSPLYIPGDSVQPVRYGRDGWLVNIISPDTLDMILVEGISFEGTYEVPKRYLKVWGDTIRIDKAVFVDVTNQNISTVEKADTAWVIRSMNPATTGVRKPPYAQRTPIGLFAIQEKKVKMYYTHDGTSEIAGYAPYASRFTNGAYVHGVPTNSANAAIIEYSWSLGTIPRSHMCVRNVSSHAKFVYDWAKIKESVVFVID